MRLLLTRAEADAARTRGALEAAGHAVLASPVLVVRSLVPVVPPRLFAGVVASSARAFGPLGGSAEGAAPPDIAHLPLFLVGRQTEAAARRHGWTGSATVAADAAALAALLCERPGRPLLYLAGRDRKPDLERALAACGHGVETLETYCAEAAPTLTPQAIDAIGGGAIDAVLHFSRRSAALFVLLCGQAALDARGLRHLCLSHDVAEPLEQADCTLVHVATAPDETAMRALVATLG